MKLSPTSFGNNLSFLILCNSITVVKKTPHKLKLMLYLVNCEVVESYYMDDPEKSEMNHIVEAESEQEAIDKVQDFYAKQDNPPYVRHWVDVNYCNAVIR
jgi:hypothetical protein